MSITIKRNTGWLGMGAKLAIKLNEEKVAKIEYDQEIRLDIPHDDARLKVKGFGYKSNEIEVENGDMVEITTPKWAYISFFLAVLSPTVLSSFIESYMLVIALIVVLVGSGLFLSNIIN